MGTLALDIPTTSFLNRFMFVCMSVDNDCGRVSFGDFHGRTGLTSLMKLFIFVSYIYDKVVGLQTVEIILEIKRQPIKIMALITCFGRR